jgi:Zn-dependent protease
MGRMYRDSFSESLWQRIARWLSASFRVGRFFRVELRLYYLALIVMPIILLRTTEGLPFAQAATFITLTTLALYVVIYVHEMGHIVAGRRYGIDTSLITLGPLGGLAHMNAGAPTPNKEIAIALAGPATHLIWLVPILPLWLLLDHGTFSPGDWFYDPVFSLVETLLYLNVALLIFNLLPFFPMDGGRAFRALLARRMHPNRATLIAVKVGLVGGVVFLGVGIFLWIVRDDLYGPILAMIGLANVMACRQEKLAALHGQGPYMSSAPRQAWEGDPDGWKQGGGVQAPAKPGFFARRKSEGDAKRRKAAATQDTNLDAEVDRVLDRLNEVGIEGLSAAERKILDRASKRRRDG